MEKTKKITKKSTAINNLLEWIDRVEERGITQLSTSKIRERIMEQKGIERSKMIDFYNESKKSDLSGKEAFKQHFKYSENGKD